MTKKIFLFLALCTTLVAFYSCTDSSSNRAALHFQTADLMTAQDAVNSSYSNISITNATGAPVTASGLFVASYDVNDCSACSGSLMTGDNAFGPMVQQVSFGDGQSIQIGQNYLYNMIYSGLSGVQLNVGSTPCQLPGCSWSGDTPNTKWCITIGVMSRRSSYTSSAYTNGSNPAANVVPIGQAVSSIPFNYKYDLVDPATFGNGSACLGPIVCDDQTLNCSVSSQQTQSFRSY